MTRQEFLKNFKARAVKSYDPSKDEFLQAVRSENKRIERQLELLTGKKVTRSKVTIPTDSQLKEMLLEAQKATIAISKRLKAQ